MKQIFILFASISALGFTTMPCAAQQAEDTVIASVSKASGDFIKRRYSIKGQWEISIEDGKTVIRFSDNFKTKNGPDLKLFLSMKNMDTVEAEAAQDNAQKIAVLKSSKGSQAYILPDGINIWNYKSVLIHCEAYSVLWGGFDIPR